MAKFNLPLFERIVRSAHLFSEEDAARAEASHPFEQRNIFENLPAVVRDLFDDGHYSQATFEVFKFLDRQISKMSSIEDSGKALMMKAFSEQSPAIKLTRLSTDTERSEQEGFKFIFAGSMMAIRNPRGHEFEVQDSMDDCLDHLCLVTLLLRRLQAAGFQIRA
jgi:uncharacterized protein (TIGR02391 family)